MTTSTSKTNEARSGVTKQTLEAGDVHDSWSKGYRTPENERFFEEAFDDLIQRVGTKPGEEFLDAGCGSGTKTFRLASRGVRVTGVDFSEYALEQARSYAHTNGFGDLVSFRRGDLLDLEIENDSFKYVLCWGVVMHIPDYERALNELVRVTRPGGYLVLSEGNMYSVQAIGLRWLKKLLGKERARLERDAIGLEFWEKSDAGDLMTRQADIPALIHELESRGMHLKERRAGQFSELYIRLRSPFLQALVHGINRFWFRRVGSGKLAHANILIFQKPN